MTEQEVTPAATARKVPWGWIAVGIAAGVAAAIAVSGLTQWTSSTEPEAAAPPAAPAPTTVEVSYDVVGDGTYFDMTLRTPTGTEQASPDLPLRTTDGGRLTHVFSPGDPVYISAQSIDGREITCRIYVDHELISENTATGEFAIAACAGTA